MATRLHNRECDHCRDLAYDTCPAPHDQAEPRWDSRHDLLITVAAIAFLSGMLLVAVIR